MAINVTKEVSIKFQPQQLAVVINCLNAGVYKEVAAVIQSIEKQVIEQMMLPVPPGDDKKVDTDKTKNK